MEIDEPPQPTPEIENTNTRDADDDEDVEDLLDLMDSAKVESNDTISILLKVMDSPKDGPKAISIQERAVYELTRAYISKKQLEAIVTFLQSSKFFTTVTKAKCAKVVRQVLDLVCTLAPTELEKQQQICEQIIAWCNAEKRSFLRQRVEAKLATILFDRQDYSAALQLIDTLLRELKQLDDKQLLVETHLAESKLHFALRNVAKSKAALTASRTAANAIYVAPLLQASIDTQSGTIHCQEGDYNTAHSYFLEAFEQLDQLGLNEEATPCLKYMMLCKILDALTKALKNNVRTNLDLTSLVTAKQALKYAGRDLEALTKIAQAASKRSLKDLEAVLQEYQAELNKDLLIQHHLHILEEQLLESNLLRLLEPYSCVELSHIAMLMELPQPKVERKLSQMILDGKFNGILNQGEGQLIVYEESQKDQAMETGLGVISNMDAVVSTLFERSKALRTMMM